MNIDKLVDALATYFGANNEKDNIRQIIGDHLVDDSRVEWIESAPATLSEALTAEEQAVQQFLEDNTSPNDAGEPVFDDTPENIAKLQDLVEAVFLKLDPTERDTRLYRLCIALEEAQNDDKDTVISIIEDMAELLQRHIDIKRVAQANARNLESLRREFEEFRATVLGLDDDDE